MPHVVSRRSALAGLGALFAWSHVPRACQAAAGRDPRLLVVLLRGGLDGLSAVAPVGDPGLQQIRTISEEGFVPLDGFFSLNPNMPMLRQLFMSGQASVIHAVSTQYRGRSHFNGQDVLESGLEGAGARSGWMNRALTIIPAGERLRAPRGLVVAASAPLIMRGSAPVDSWQAQRYTPATAVTVAQLLDLYEQTDPDLAQALRDGASLKNAVPATADGKQPPGPKPPGPDFRTDALAAALLMAKPDGPRLGAMSYAGWDTHAQQGQIAGALGRQLRALDGAVGALQQGFGPAWRDTVVVIVTEFGRTARLNGTGGTDHGTGTTAFMIGGGVKGRRVVADWPGLRAADLYEGRDLRPTTDIRSVFKGVLADLFGVGDDRLGTIVFPGSQTVPTLRGLCA